ncbi:MAG: hypothetical protein Q7J82_03795 [Coriobacteriia bacterium]|nr:hypothetical protein [Coriobacteriia bacterium]
MRSRNRMLLPLLALMLAVAALSGCGSDTTTTIEPLPNEGEIGRQILDGEALVAERCIVCHDLQRVDETSYDAVGWEATVERMADKGAQLTEDEKSAVVEYLSNR